MKPKFELGQDVKIVADGRKGMVKNVLFDSFNGLRYQVMIKSLNFTTNEIIDGTITLKEDELELVKEDVK